MTHDDPDDDEDWYDDAGDESDAEETAPCPECGQPVYDLADRCPACGYWLTDADRDAMSANASKPVWTKLTAIVLLGAILIGLLAIVAAAL